MRSSRNRMSKGPPNPQTPSDPTLTGENRAPPAESEARPALQRPALALPHESDQSTRAKGHEPAEVIEQAAQDLAAGRQDTEERGKAAEHFHRRWGGRRTRH